MGDDLRYWVGFNLVRGIGPVRLRALIETFGTIEAAWTASEAALRSTKLNDRATDNLLQVRRQCNLDAILTQIDHLDIHVLTWDSPDYPPLLAQVADAPPVLYARGTITPGDEWAVAMVGTRRASVYGREVARRLAEELGRNGVTVVSGLARGIDGIAHKTAIEAGGRSLAVLGCGVDQVYPPEHRKLAESIMANGALVSDYPLGTQPEAQNFPPRNRIISGMSLGTIVVEAGLRSGALITADFALDQGREVFAVPGSILSPGSAGCNRLLRDGAHVLTEVRDVLEVLHLDQVPDKQAARLVLPETPTEAKLFESLTGEPHHLDDLSRQSGIPIEVVSGTLVMMELKGMVRQVGALQYVRAYEPGGVYDSGDADPAQEPSQADSHQVT
ncbi:MAG: DNA-processing protein DprA [Anaerolineae bacterium]|nr:DNA-processing protein DprA [Anaerolineae bacterium]